MAWEPGYQAGAHRIPASGLSVNTHDRNDVLSFYHAVYHASEGYEKRIRWNGNYSGKAGTVSNDFVLDVQRRLNYFRAMAGVPADVRVNSGARVVISPTDTYAPSASSTKAAAAQNAALLMAVNYNPQTGSNPALTHNPARNLKLWSTLAWNGSAKGSFAFGMYGPGAITEYMVERQMQNAATSSWNSLVGHRGWNLYTAATDYATGDQPGKSAQLPPTNVLYVVHDQSELRKIQNPNFVSYPSAGFFPGKLNSPFWSLSRQGADFSSASVRMTNSAGKAVPLLSVSRTSSYGDPSIIWHVNAATANHQIVSDTRYHVHVTGIKGVPGTPTSHSYTVTLVNVGRLLDNQKVTGPAKMAFNKSGAFKFKAPARSESIQIVASRKSSKKWTENAENPAKAGVVDHTSPTYPLCVNPTSFPGFGAMSGKNAFRLTFPTSYDLKHRGVPEQIFELKKELLPKKGAKLSFLYRRGFMTKNSILAIESSADDGLTWKALGQPLRGVSDTTYEMSARKSVRTIPKSSKPIRIRFRYHSTGGSIYTHEAAPKSPTGIFLDDITVIKCDWLETKKTTSLSPSANTFNFAAKTAGAKLTKGEQWHLRLRAKVGDRWFHHGPSKAVSITAK